MFTSEICIEKNNVHYLIHVSSLSSKGMPIRLIYDIFHYSTRLLGFLLMWSYLAITVSSCTCSLALGFRLLCFMLLSIDPFCIVCLLLAAFVMLVDSSSLCVLLLVCPCMSIFGVLLACAAVYASPSLLKSRFDCS